MHIKAANTLLSIKLTGRIETTHFCQVLKAFKSVCSPQEMAQPLTNKNGSLAQDAPPALTVANHVIGPHEQHSHGDDDAGEHGLDEQENEDLGSSSDDEWQYDDREDSDDEVFSAYHF